MRLCDVDEVYKVLTDYYHLRTEIQHKALKEAIEKVSTVDVDSLNAAHESIGYEKGYCDGYAEALYETDNAEPMPTIEPAITYEQVKEYCRKRCLVIVTAETFNDMKTIWSLLQKGEKMDEEEQA